MILATNLRVKKIIPSLGGLTFSGLLAVKRLDRDGVSEPQSLLECKLMECQEPDYIWERVIESSNTRK